jgi:hypothetical protein
MCGLLFLGSIYCTARGRLKSETTLAVPGFRQIFDYVYGYLPVEVAWRYRGTFECTILRIAASECSRFWVMWVGVTSSAKSKLVCIKASVTIGPIGHFDVRKWK